MQCACYFIYVYFVALLEAINKESFYTVYWMKSDVCTLSTPSCLSSLSFFSLFLYGSFSHFVCLALFSIFHNPTLPFRLFVVFFSLPLFYFLKFYKNQHLFLLTKLIELYVINTYFLV